MQSEHITDAGTAVAPCSHRSMKCESAGPGTVYLIRAQTANGIAYFTNELDAFEFIARGVVLDIEILARPHTYNAEVTPTRTFSSASHSLLRCPAA